MIKGHKIMLNINKYAAILFVSFISTCIADCPLDHFLIGKNEDGITGTHDDDKLFVDCTQKYRHSDPDHNEDPTWLHWYYPMYYNVRYDRYAIGEPGFDVIQNNDPNRQLTGTPNVDYRIMIRCVAIKPNFSARNTTEGILLDEVGDEFNHSVLSESHLHLEYRAPAPSGGQDLQWITYVLYDAMGIYQDSEPLTVVFVREPLAGDLVVDGIVDIEDLAELYCDWLKDGADRPNDYYERADANRDGRVDLLDFSLFAANWRKNL